MMQHELYPHPTYRSRLHFPFIAVLQSDLTDGDERRVAPLMVEVRRAGSHRSIPLVVVQGRPFSLLISQIYPVHTRYLKHPLGSVAKYRDDILAALDWLFTGI